MTISKKQLQDNAAEAYRRGQIAGAASERTRLYAEIQGRKFASIEDTLIQMGQLARANADLGTAMATVIRQLLESTPK